MCSTAHCPAGHVLEQLADSQFFTCDACGSRDFPPPVHHCGQCSYDLCPACAAHSSPPIAPRAVPGRRATAGLRGSGERGIRVVPAIRQHPVSPEPLPVTSGPVFTSPRPNSTPPSASDGSSPIPRATRACAPGTATPPPLTSRSPRLPPLSGPQSRPQTAEQTPQNSGALSPRPASPLQFRVGGRVLLPGGTLAVVTAVLADRGLARVAVDGQNVADPVRLCELSAPPGFLQAAEVPTPQGHGMTSETVVYGPVRVGSCVVIGPRRPLTAEKRAGSAGKRPVAFLDKLRETEGVCACPAAKDEGLAAYVTALCGVDTEGCPVVSLSVDGFELPEPRRVRDLVVITP
eukprot:m51a1_g8397 hypothetical protein (347) ;mRNA; f:225681-226821